MNFKLFIENSVNIEDLFLEAKYKTGIVDKAIKVKLIPDNIDRELFMKYSATFPDEARNSAIRQQLSSLGIKPSVPLAAKIIRARYGIATSHGPGATDHIQNDALHHKIYFTKPKGEFANLIINGKEMPTPENIGYTTLQHKLEHYPVGDDQTANIKKDIPRFTHPAVQGKEGTFDKLGNVVTQTNGINKATLGISGHPAEIGWSIAHKKQGIKAKKLNDEEKEYAKKDSAIDLAKDKTDEEKDSIKKLTAAGNNFIDNVLFNTQEMDSELKDADGDPLTNHQVLQMVKREIMRKHDRSVDPQDVLHAFAFLLRQKYGDFDKYENANKMIKNLVTNAFHDVKESMGIGRKQGEDLKHGKNYGLKAGSLDAGGEEGETSRLRQPTVGDLKRRQSLITKEVPAEDPLHPRQEVPEEPEHHGIKTYKTSKADPISATVKKSGNKLDTVSLGKDVENASDEELANRRKDFIKKIRTMAGTSDKPMSASDRLKAKFGLR